MSFGHADAFCRHVQLGVSAALMTFGTVLKARRVKEELVLVKPRSWTAPLFLLQILHVSFVSSAGLITVDLQRHTAELGDNLPN